MQDRERAAPVARDDVGARRKGGRLESTLPPRYRRQAWLAVAALAVFLLLYAALAGWFLRTAWRLSFGGSGDAGGRVFGFLAAACAAVLAAFMIKGLFFIRRGKPEGLVELKPAEQPRLFKFLHQLADEAGAPRPHKVYASARVNAAVFYDLSLLNFLLPSRKNLEIGLSLVNALTLGEVRAVLAHEFGHFAQRSMAVGRWVYIAHQITAQLVARRDKLDDFVDGLSRMDLRIAWIGWVLQTIVWAIRSLIDLAFRGVYLMQQALSREMELQADLVAVSLTGSDALIHALSKLGAADDSFDRVVSFAEGEQARGRPVADLFELHAQQMKRMAQVLDDPLYGRVPLVPLADPAAHRVFKADLTQPPRMWQSHPRNHEREANAKKTYVVAPLDDRPAWVLFDDASALRARVTRELLPAGEHAPVPAADTLARLDERFHRTNLHRRYQGAYLGRSVTRAFEEASALWGPEPGAVADLASLYPKSLVEVIERLRQLDSELGQLRALDAGVVEASGGAIHYRGEERSRRDLPGLIERVAAERDEARATLDTHERRVHRTFLAAARQADAVAAPDAIRIEDALKGLLAALHYAEHGEAIVRDLQHAASVRYRMVTGGGKITHDKLQPLLLDCNHLHQAITRLHDDRADVKLAPEVLARLGAASWDEALGAFELPLASGDNLSQWLGVIDGWVNATAKVCTALRNAALDELLLLERALDAHVREGAPAPAPAGVCQVPPGYRRLLLSQQQQRKVTLTGWQRFLRASGRGPALLRLAAAGGIVGTVLAVGANIGHAELVIYDALTVPVRVQVDGHDYDVEPGVPLHVDVDPDSTQAIATTTRDGRVVERFDAKIEGAFGTQVYNVAGASPLVRWTAVYGPASAEPMQMLGAPRLVSVSVDTLFGDPPQTVETKHGQGAVRHVLRGFAGGTPEDLLAPLRSDMAAMSRVALAHARWDADHDSDVESWFSVAAGQPEALAVVTQRVAESPEDVSLHRVQQKLARGPAHEAVCARDRARAQERPDDGDRAYVALRCDEDDPARDAAFAAAHARWPDNAWLAYSVGWVDAEHDRWQAAIADFELAKKRLPRYASVTNEMEARILRYTGAPADRMRPLMQGTDRLAKWLEIEQPGFRSPADDGPLMAAYAALVHGEFVDASSIRDLERYDRGRLMRLQAASDGAAPELAKRGLDLPFTDGLDEDTFWPTLGLALRAHQDVAALHQRLLDPARMKSASLPAHLQRAWDVVIAGAQPGARAVADADLAGLDPEERGRVYETLAVALGAKAPARYRDAASRLLFAVERPYFRT